MSTRANSNRATRENLSQHGSINPVDQRTTDVSEELLDSHLARTFMQAHDSWERRTLLRQFYGSATSQIIAAAKEHITQWGIDPYFFEWRFNRNEKSLWGSIRRTLVVMYPEFPVLDYFVDFGNPYLKIALEADSKAFHDPQKDLERDRRLANIGWKTFRVTYEENFAQFVELGTIGEMLHNGQDGQAAFDLENWLLHTSDGVVDAIEFFYFLSKDQQKERVERFPDYLQFATQTLVDHKYAEFDLPEILSN